MKRYAFRYLMVSLVCAVCMMASSNLQAQCLQGWRYSAPIVITNSSTTALSNYQVQLTINTSTLIAAGKLKVDGSDLRFTEGGCCATIVCHYIESGLNTPTTRVWLKIRSLPANTSTSVSMMYGNSIAPSANDPYCVFPVFDEFNGTSIDSTRWSVNGTGKDTSVITVSGGAINFSGGNVTLRSAGSITGPTITEMWVNNASGEWPGIALLRSGNQWVGYSLFLETITANSYHLGNTNPSNTHFSATRATWTGMIVMPGIWRLEWPATGDLRGWFPGSGASYYDSATTLGTANVAVGLLSTGAGQMSVDWVRARAYAATPPTAGAPGPEQVIVDPAITVQPTGTRTCSGTSVSFVVSATGSTNTYQWRRNGLAIPGATDTSYRLPSVTLNDTGRYDVVISSPCSLPLTSNQASLTVDVPHRIVSQPTDQALCLGDPASLGISVAGNPVSIQWMKDGIDIPGATSPNFVVASVASTDTGVYTARVQGPCAPTEISNPVRISVAYPAVIISQSIPARIAVCRTLSTTFSVTAAGTNRSYQWYKNGSPISGATSDGLTIASKIGNEGAYHVVVSAPCGSPVTSDTGILSVALDPIISEQPLPLVRRIGESASFTVTIQGEPPFTYQWQKDGINIPGATNSSFSIPSIKLRDFGEYNCVIGNACTPPFVVTNEAGLYLDTKIGVILPPQSQTVCAGDATSLHVVADGELLRYQWRRNGFLIPGATSSTYLIPRADDSDAGVYDCIIKSANGSIRICAPATVTINAPTLIDSHPTGRTSCLGTDITFTVEGRGTNVQYQWQKNNIDLSGATGNTYSITNIGEEDLGNYRCKVWGSCGEIQMSRVAVLAQEAAPVISEHPRSRVVQTGSTVRFSVAASGTNLRYQWRKDGRPIVGAIDSVLTIASATIDEIGMYDAVVEATCVEIVSNQAQLEINDDISAVPFIGDATTGSLMRVVPHPASGLTRLIVNLPDRVKSDATARLRLYDLFGDIILDLTEAFAASGFTVAEFDATKIPSGTYYCRFVARGWSGTLGVVVVKK